MRILLPLLLIVFFALLISSAVAVGPSNEEPLCTDFGDYFHWVSRTYGDGQYMDITISGRHAFAAARNRGIHVYDLQNPDEPARVAELPCGEDALGVRVHDTVGVVSSAREDEDIQGYYYTDTYVIDVTDPGALSIILAREAFPSRCSIEFEGHVFFGTNDGLTVLDVTDFTSPLFLDADPIEEKVSNMVLVGHHLLALTPTRLCALDISVPGSPSLVSEISIPDAQRDLMVTGQRALVCSRDKLVEIDISSPGTPAIISELPLEYFPRQLLADGDRAFIHSGKSEGTDIVHYIRVADIGTPGLPAFRGEVQVAEHAELLVFRAPYLYGYDYAGLFVVDVRDADFPTVAMRTGQKMLSLDFANNESHLYGTNDFGLSAFSFGNSPLEPPLMRIQTAGLARGLEIIGHYAFVSDWRDGVQVIDIETRGAGETVATLPIAGPTSSLAADNGYLYVGDQSNGIVVADISEPAAPVVLSTVALENGAQFPVVEGEMLALASGRELYFYDKSDPEAMSLLGTMPVPSNIGGIALADGLVFATSGRDLLIISNADESGGAAILSTLELSHYGEGIAVSGDYAYVGTFGASVNIVDISDPIHPFLAANQSVPDACYNVVFQDGYLYGSGGRAGVQIIDVATPTQPNLVGRAGFIVQNPTTTHLLRFVRDAEINRGCLYFVDEFGLQAVPLQCREDNQTIEVTLDLKPGNQTDPVNCGSRGLVPVAILTTPEFDALNVNHETVVFGPGEATESHSNRHGMKRHESDVDHDGDLDLLFHFRTQEASLDCAASEATLTGQTFDGRNISGVVTYRSTPRSHQRPHGKLGLKAKPNPFNPSTTIMFNLDRQQAVSLRIYDLSGRLINTLLNDQFASTGRHEVVWNGRDDAGRAVASGTYFYRLEAGSYSETKRVVLIK